MPHIQYGPHTCLLGVDKYHAVEVAHLGLRYEPHQADALKDLSLSIDTGTHTALIGPNGAGKSTLLRAIAGLLHFHSGSIRVFGSPSGHCPHQVVYLPQRSRIDWSFPITLERFVLTGAYVHCGWFRRPNLQAHKDLSETLDLLGLDALRTRPLRALSGGQQQRALFARTLLHRARLLLLDEPLNAIDNETTQLIYTLLQYLKQQGKTVIMATHDIERTAHAFDTIIALKDGCLAEKAH